MKKNKVLRMVIAVVVVLLVVGGGRKLIMGKKAALAKSPKFQFHPRPVETVKAVKGDLKEGYRYLAVVEPFQMADVSARVTAVVDKVMFWEGDSVKAGDVLAVLDDRQVKDAIAVVEAQASQTMAEGEALRVTLLSLRQTLVYWENEKERTERLAKKGATSETTALATAEKYNAARGNVQNVEKKLLVTARQEDSLKRKADELKTTLAYYTIKSPFDGILSARLTNPGDLAAPGKSLFNIEDRSAIKLTFSVPQGDLKLLKDGVLASFVYNGRTYQTKINRVFPKLNRARMLMVEAVLADSMKSPDGSCSQACLTLPLGVYVDLSVVYAVHSDAVLVPIQALIETSEHPEVYIVKEGKLHRKQVKMLGKNLKQAAVKGIQDGDEVVVHSFLGWASLVEGMNVEAKK